MPSTAWFGCSATPRRSARTSAGNAGGRGAMMRPRPGHLAAAALVGIGSRSVPALIAALQQPQWISRKNATWALGALDDPRGVAPVTAALQDREAPVRAAGGVGARRDGRQFGGAGTDRRAERHRRARAAAGRLGARRDRLEGRGAGADPVLEGSLMRACGIRRHGRSGPLAIAAQCRDWSRRCAMPTRAFAARRPGRSARSGTRARPRGSSPR